jgi:hypothetical protein
MLYALLIMDYAAKRFVEEDAQIDVVLSSALVAGKKSG